MDGVAHDASVGMGDNCSVGGTADSGAVDGVGVVSIFDDNSSVLGCSIN